MIVYVPDIFTVFSYRSIKVISIKPFELNITQDKIDFILNRVSSYPWHEMPSWPPKSCVVRIYNGKWWTEMLRGGHFAAMEEPEALIEDIRAFVQLIKI